jgi:hypothetical protein
LLTFSLREKENFSPIIFFIHKINTKVIIVLVCVTYNIQCMKVTFLTVNIKLFLQWLLSSKGYQFSISRFSNANLLYIYIFFWTLFVKASLLWSKHFVELIFFIWIKQSILNSQRNKNFSGYLFNHLS